MGAVISRYVDTHDSDDEDDDGLQFELPLANELSPGLANNNLAAGDAPAPDAGLYFGGNILQGVNAADPANQAIVPLLRRLANNTPTLTQTKTLRSDVNVNKASIQLLPRSDSSTDHLVYDLQFNFDATSAGVVKVLYCVDEAFNGEKFYYNNAGNGHLVSQVPTSPGTSQNDLNDLQADSMDSSSILNSKIGCIERHFAAGLGQTFFTELNEGLKISEYSQEWLLWNQLEQQILEEERAAKASKKEEEDDDSGELNGDVHINMESTDEVELEVSQTAAGTTDDGNTSSDTSSSDEEDVATKEASPSTVTEEEASPSTVTEEEARRERRRRERRRRRKDKKRRLPAAPRPKGSSTPEAPKTVRNLIPILISIEPDMSSAPCKKNYLAAQITHLCLVKVMTAIPKSEILNLDDNEGDKASNSLSTDGAEEVKSSGGNHNELLEDGATVERLSLDKKDDETETTTSSTSSRSSKKKKKRVWKKKKSKSKKQREEDETEYIVKYISKLIRQKILVNGSVYNVYDVFGVDQHHPSDLNIIDGTAHGQTECVICMTEPKNTLVIPCRHMCLCEACADTLKVQSVKCPICRGPVRSLLKIEISHADDPGSADSDDDDHHDSHEEDDEEDDDDDGEEVALVRKSKTAAGTSVLETNSPGNIPPRSSFNHADSPV